MANETLTNKENYLSLLEALGTRKDIDREFVYAVFSNIVSLLPELVKTYPLLSRFQINIPQLSVYIVSEHGFYLDINRGVKTQEEIIADPNYLSMLSSIAVDKYYSNEHTAVRMNSYASRYNPIFSTLDLYLNFVLTMLSRFKRGDPERTLLIDVMVSGFSMAKCVSSLLENGYQSEAFSTWRTLHENECILKILITYREQVAQAYLRHMRYGQAFRSGLSSKEETDACFLEIKERMREVNLKSKDMKRFIEYGWLLGVPGFKEKILNPSEGYKFNFRDGVQKVAELSQYSKLYETSSEITHSSPLLIYASKEATSKIVTMALYESFFRLEKSFSAVYLGTVSAPEREAYLRMRGLYYQELQVAYRYLSRSANKKAEAPKSIPAPEEEGK